MKYINIINNKDKTNKLISVSLIERAFALSLFIFLSPVFLFIIFFIATIDGNPIFFIQKRVGKDKKLFSMVKFRTMKKNVSGNFYTEKYDKRITKTGKWLRKLSLDELPQLFNIIMGEMAFVGPRPDLEVQKINYDEEEWNVRCSVYPGITGLAQVCGRSSLTLNQRKGLDLWYVAQRSKLLDLWILIKTLRIIYGENSV